MSRGRGGAGARARRAGPCCQRTQGGDCARRGSGRGRETAARFPLAALHARPRAGRGCARRRRCGREAYRGIQPTGFCHPSRRPGRANGQGAFFSGEERRCRAKSGPRGRRAPRVPAARGAQIAAARREALRVPAAVRLAERGEAPPAPAPLLGPRNCASPASLLCLAVRTVARLRGDVPSAVVLCRLFSRKGRHVAACLACC